MTFWEAKKNWFTLNSNKVTKLKLIGGPGVINNLTTTHTCDFLHGFKRLIYKNTIIQKKLPVFSLPALFSNKLALFRKPEEETGLPKPKQKRKKYLVPCVFGCV